MVMTLSHSHNALQVSPLTELQKKKQTNKQNIQSKSMMAHYFSSKKKIHQHMTNLLKVQP